MRFAVTGTDRACAVSRCEYYPLDVTDSRSIQRLKEMIEEKYGEIDCLVNNAAIGLKVAPCSCSCASASSLPPLSPPPSLPLPLRHIVCHSLPKYVFPSILPAIPVPTVITLLPGRNLHACISAKTPRHQLLRTSHAFKVRHSVSDSEKPPSNYLGAD
eukprot:41979-Rhodomonas_salina.1